MEMCTDMCTDMCVDICMDMCIDMCVDMCVDTCMFHAWCESSCHRHTSCCTGPKGAMSPPVRGYTEEVNGRS